MDRFDRLDRLGGVDFVDGVIRLDGVDFVNDVDRFDSNFLACCRCFFDRPPLPQAKIENLGLSHSFPVMT